MRKWWFIPCLVLLGVCFLGYREYRIIHRSFPQVVIEKNLVLFQVNSHYVFGMGRIDSSRAQALFREMVSFFSSQTISSIWDIEEGQEVRGSDFAVQSVSPNIVRIMCGGETFWFLGDDFDAEEQGQVVQSGVSLSSDWWVMTKNRLPEFLPVPTKGILYAGDRAPSQKTTTFAQDKKIPLISASETGGFLLSFRDIGWDLHSRN